MAGIVYVFLPQAGPFGFVLGEVQRLGVNYVIDLFVRPKWQTKSLLNASKNYLIQAEKLEYFIRVFETDFPGTSYIRA